MKRKHLLLTLLLLGLSGCTLFSLRTPFTDVQKLGTVLKPGENISIQNADGTVTVEYVAPTKRRIIWNGESREILLFKSSLVNGIYADRAKLRPGPIGKMKHVGYTEATAVFKSQAEVDNMISMFTGYGYEHRPEERMLVHLEVQRFSNLGLRFLETEYMTLVIKKYEIAQ